MTAPEKYILTTDGVHIVNIKVINPRYVEFLEADNVYRRGVQDQLTTALRKIIDGDEQSVAGYARSVLYKIFGSPHDAPA